MNYMLEVKKIEFELNFIGPNALMIDLAKRCSKTDPFLLIQFLVLMIMIEGTHIVPMPYFHLAWPLMESSKNCFGCKWLSFKSKNLPAFALHVTWIIHKLYINIWLNTSPQIFIISLGCPVENDHLLALGECIMHHRTSQNKHRDGLIYGRILGRNCSEIQLHSFICLNH